MARGRFTTYKPLGKQGFKVVALLGIDMKGDWSDHDAKAAELAEDSYSWEDTGDSDNTFTDEEIERFAELSPANKYSPEYATEQKRNS